MSRCLQLAQLGAGYVAPNPMVGSVLVHNNKIIGEGYHMKYGGPHAEVNCISSVSESDQHLISHSTLYVSLEPCAHFGKTPPCADLIIHHHIPHVVIGSRDPFDEVNGKGIEKLKNAGIKVDVGILKDQCDELNKRFFTYHTRRQPYVVLKWAQSVNGAIAGTNSERIKISNAFTDRLVHQWRGQESGILVGTNTAAIDNPKLDVRHATGKNPIRLVIDKELKLPSTLHLFNGLQQTVVFNFQKHEVLENLLYYKIDPAKPVLQEIYNACYELKIQSILVEGGTKLLQSIIDAGLWDEAKVIVGGKSFIENGLQAPQLKNAFLQDKETIDTDNILHYKRQHH